MILSEELISIIFRLINFGILLYSFYYVYTHYIYGIVWRDIEADEKKVAILAQQKDAFHQQERLIQQEIQKQQHTISDLMRVLEQWQAAAEKTQRAAQDTHRDRQEAIRKKVALQSEHIAQYMLDRRAFSRAIDQLETSLADHFNDKDRGSDYIINALNYMEKDR